MTEIKPKTTRGTVLRFTPYAWAKLIHMRDAGKTEIGGYGITGTSDPLLVTDFLLVKQECTPVEVELDEEDSNNFIDRMIDFKFQPWQFQNIWIHTHPGNCARPSLQDENNFDKNFSHPHWAIFFILASGGDTYCRIRHNVGPGIDVTIQHEIDYGVGFSASNFVEWQNEYKDKVGEKKLVRMASFHSQTTNYDNKKESLPHHRDIISRGNFWDDMEEEDVVPVDEIADTEEIYIAHGVVTYWDEDTEQYYEYNVQEDMFWRESDQNNEEVIMFAPDPEPAWMNMVRRWGRSELENMSKEMENADAS
jgi:hypothetical protein